MELLLQEAECDYNSWPWSNTCRAKQRGKLPDSLDHFAYAGLRQEPKKLNFPGYKGSSEYHKRRDGDQAKKIQTLSYLLYQTEHAFSDWTETLSKCQQRWGACSSTAEISFWSQRESSALEMRDILALQWKGDNPQLFLSALLSCSDLLSNQIIRFAATSANTYSMKSLKHKR